MTRDTTPARSSRPARTFLAALGVLSAALALWAWLDAPRFPSWTLPVSALLALLFLCLARWASDRWARRLRGWFTGWS